ncbi:hypothetical protein QYE76_043104 [Lolium multiflorum]|uniref:CCHC-type domain-containing protein n=1 Tax=Lolium multiflorum TaxID=4521 RepID=A0AAD8TIH4_LOLMU|nr:hypothetical protein QYE76_043104 [Lolium multiflorum]
MGDAEGDSQGDADGDPRGGDSTRRSELCSRPSPGGGLAGQFWALAPGFSDEEAVNEVSISPPSSPSPPVVETFSSPTLGDYLRAAEELGGSLRSSRRSAFAPGGRGSRFSSGGGRHASSGGGNSSHRPGRAKARDGALAAGGWDSRVLVRDIPPPPLASAPAASSRRPRQPVAGSAPAARPAVRLDRVEEEGFPPLWTGPVDLRWLSPPRAQAQAVPAPAAEVAATSLGLPQAGPDLLGPPPLIPQPGWLWLRKGSSTLSLGFPASAGDVSRHSARARTVRVAPPPSPLTRSFAQVTAAPTTMERQQGGSGGANGGAPTRLGAGAVARPATRGGTKTGRRQARPVASRSRRRRSAPARWLSRVPDARERPAPTRLPRATTPLPHSVEIAAGKQSVAAPKGGSGQGPNQPGGVAKDGAAASRMECFKCGRMGHFQADCTYPPVCLLCGVEGHFSAACTSKGRQPSLRVLGQAVAGESFFSLDFEEDDEEEELVSNGAIISFGAVSLSARELLKVHGAPMCGFGCNKKNLMKDIKCQVCLEDEDEGSTVPPTMEPNISRGDKDEDEYEEEDWVVSLRDKEEIKELKAQVTSLKNDLVKGHEGKCKLDTMLSMQQSPNDKSGLGFKSNNKNKSNNNNNNKKGQVQVKDPAKIVCFKCNIEGHHVRSCPLKKKQKGKRPQAQTHIQPQVEEIPLPKKKQANAPIMEKPSEKKEKKRTCYICREKGHISSLCTIGTSSNSITIDDVYSLRKDEGGNVFAKYVGAQSGVKKRTIWVAKPIVTNLLGPNLVGDQQSKI